MTLNELQPGMLFDVEGSDDPFVPNGEWRLLFQPHIGDLGPNGPNPIIKYRGNLWYAHPVGKSFLQFLCFDMVWDNDKQFHFRQPPAST
jgi:hypothetical protein